jgi:hypothetical protein
MVAQRIQSFSGTEIYVNLIIKWPVSAILTKSVMSLRTERMMKMR